jgi:hypothetical protein
MTITKAILAALICVCALAQTETPGPILACNMKAISSADRPRYNVLLRKIKAAVKQQRELPDGYAWELDGKSITLPETAEWVMMERRCCSFLTLQIEATGNQINYWVNLKGPEGVKAFLVSEFGIGR